MQYRAVFISLSCLSVSLSIAASVEAGMSAPANIQALKERASREILQNNPRGALDTYEEALKLARKELGLQSMYLAELYYDMGVLALGNNMFDQSESYLTSAVRVNPSSVTARVKLAELLNVRQRPEEAARQMQAVLRRHPNSLPARQMLAVSFLKMGDHTRATQEFSRFDAVVHGRPAPVVPLPAAAPAAVLPAVPISPAAKNETKKMRALQQKPPIRPGKRARQRSHGAETANRQARAAKPEREKQATKANVTQPKKMSRRQSGKQGNARAGAQASAGKQEAFSRQQSAYKKSPVKRTLIPPPPPVVPPFPGMIPPPAPGYANPAYQLRTDILRTDITLKQKAPKAPAEPAKLQPREDKPVVQNTGSPQDDDFLLEWADRGGKKKK